MHSKNSFSIIKSLFLCIKNQFQPEENCVWHKTRNSSCFRWYFHISTDVIAGVSYRLRSGTSRQHTMALDVHLLFACFLFAQLGLLLSDQGETGFQSSFFMSVVNCDVDIEYSLLRSSNLLIWRAAQSEKVSLDSIISKLLDVLTRVCVWEMWTDLDRRRVNCGRLQWTPGLWVQFEILCEFGLLEVGLLQQIYEGVSLPGVKCSSTCQSFCTQLMLSAACVTRI